MRWLESRRQRWKWWEGTDAGYIGRYGQQDSPTNWASDTRGVEGNATPGSKGGVAEG